MSYIEDVEKYKSILNDLEKVTITGSMEDGVSMINVKDGSEKPLKEIRGMMKYLDAEGNVICEKEYQIKASDLEKKMEFLQDLMVSLAKNLLQGHR
ncbi:MAG: hypothetical protein R2799_13980 [Crocinitomicaceae bacterium]